MSSVESNQHDYRKGVLLFLLFMLCDSAVAVLTKLNTQHMSLQSYNFWRAAAALVAILIWLYRQGRLQELWPRPVPWPLIGTAFLGLISTTLFTYCYKVLPTADVFAVVNAAPFFVSLLSIMLLGDRIAPRHYIAITIGFLGALFIIRPGSAMFSLGGALAMLTCFLYALTIVLSGWLSRRHSTLVIVAYNMGFMVLCFAPFAFDVTENFAAFDVWLMILTCGLFITYRIAIVASLRYAPSAYLSPLEYFSILLVAAMAYALYDEVPAPSMWVGAAIITAAGLYILRTPQHVQHGAKKGWLN